MIVKDKNSHPFTARIPEYYWPGQFNINWFNCIPEQFDQVRRSHLPNNTNIAAMLLIYKFPAQTPINVIRKFFPEYGIQYDRNHYCRSVLQSFAAMGSGLLKEQSSEILDGSNKIMYEDATQCRFDLFMHICMSDDRQLIDWYKENYIEPKHYPKIQSDRVRLFDFFQILAESNNLELYSWAFKYFCLESMHYVRCPFENIYLSLIKMHIRYPKEIGFYLDLEYIIQYCVRNINKKSFPLEIWRVYIIVLCHLDKQGVQLPFLKINKSEIESLIYDICDVFQRQIANPNTFLTAPKCNRDSEAIYLDREFGVLTTLSVLVRNEATRAMLYEFLIPKKTILLLVKIKGISAVPQDIKIQITEILQRLASPCKGIQDATIQKAFPDETTYKKYKSAFEGFYNFQQCLFAKKKETEKQELPPSIVKDIYYYRLMN